MSRPPRGQDVLDSALQVIASATTVEQLRQAQAVVLPLVAWKWIVNALLN